MKTYFSINKEDTNYKIIMGKRKNLERITEKTKIWEPYLDVVMPIEGSCIMGFKEWINWNSYSSAHRGLDFAAYLDKRGRYVLGLPSDTPVRAIADGIVRQVSQGLAEGDGYATFINIEHGKEKNGLFSGYHHVYPLVTYGQAVKKGEKIAALHKDEGKLVGRLVHLHLVLSNAWSIPNRTKVNPAIFYPKINKLKARPQGSKCFQIPKFKKQQKIHIANFRHLKVNGK